MLLKIPQLFFLANGTPLLYQTEQMMQNMEEAGSPMVMQSREDIEEEMAEMAESMGMTKEEMDAMMAMGGGGGDDMGGGGGDDMGGGGGDDMDGDMGGDMGGGEL